VTLLRNNLRQVVCTLQPLSPSSIIWYQRKLGSKQAYHVVHQPVSRGLAVFADAWLSGWLAEISADLRQTVAHKRWFHDDALYKSTTLLFTLHCGRCRPSPTTMALPTARRRRRCSSYVGNCWLISRHRLCWRRRAITNNAAHGPCRRPVNSVANRLDCSEV